MAQYDRGASLIVDGVVSWAWAVIVVEYNGETTVAYTATTQDEAALSTEADIVSSEATLPLKQIGKTENTGFLT
ncbi:MAG: hypothetical protein COB59_12390 [Rhodospirillaceae bacterium]|nr:MAG: hypothetical protein COB59_12390 [Rhodospirillaceae bacterium]